MTTVIDADTFSDRIDATTTRRAVVRRPRRHPARYESWRIADSIHYFYKPPHEFDLGDFEAETGLGPGDAIVTACAKGKASLDFAEELEGRGLRRRHGRRGRGMRWLVECTTGPRFRSPRRATTRSTSSRSSGARRDVSGTSWWADRRRIAPSTPMAPTTSPSQSTSPVTAATSGGRRPPRATPRSRRSSTPTSTPTTSPAVGTLADELGVPYYLPAAAAERDVAYAFEPLARNETLDVGGVSVKALATPGHTDDGARAI